MKRNQRRGDFYCELKRFFSLFFISQEHCRTIWVPEIRKYADSTPIFLVGTKDDLTESSMENDRVSYGEAKRVAAEVRLVSSIFG